MTTLDRFVTDSERVLMAKCAECGDVHPLHKRNSAGDTPASTKCPACDGVEYSSKVVRDDDGNRVAT